MRELQRQFVSALLVVLTVAAMVAAVVNYQQQKKFFLPDDGVTWVDRNSTVLALHVQPDSPAANAGVREGDILRRIKTLPIRSSLEVAPVLLRLGSWKAAEYALTRGGVEFSVPVIIGQETRTAAVIKYQYAVGVAYLIIGLIVYFRRSNAPHAGHFYVLCLASFVLAAFHYTGKLNTFDKVIYWGNVTAGLFAPAIFLHFCLIFPDELRWLRRRAAIYGLYLTPTLLVAIWFGLGVGRIHTGLPLVELRWLLDRLWLAYFSALYLAGAGLLAWRYRRAGDPVQRQQLKWLRNGVIGGVLPFILFYALPYVGGMIPGPTQQLAVLSLILMPLTWAYAIVRYRLMAADIIFQQGYVYTLATVAVLGACYGLFFSIGQFDQLGAKAVISLILIATFLFQPIRNYLQEQLERNYFYKDRYDYRRTLIEFARELSAETNLDHMLHLVADRLLQTLALEHVAVFVDERQAGEFSLKFAMRAPRREHTDGHEHGRLDLSFLSSTPDQPYYFFERTRHLLDVVSRELPASVRHTLAELDLTYYLPCSVRGRTIAYLGVSRTVEHEFLPQEDVELLLTLTGYVGIAIENARLYQSLQDKVAEFERLKEFSENIVESVNVGILAADLNDRVESWNSPMERLTGIPREAAVGRSLRELFPVELCAHVEEARESTAVSHVYKFPLRTDATLDLSDVSAARPARELLLNLAIAPLVSRENEQIGRLIIIDDVTDQVDLERRLVQADKLTSIGLLAAGVAHEVNTPLAVISTYAQMLAKQVSGDASKALLLEKITKQTFRASEIVNSLLNFSRTSTREFGDVDLNRVVRETVALVQHQLDKAQVQVSFDLDDTAGPIRGNANKLQQVLLNLILNARDAMEGGGSLHLRSWQQEGALLVEIEDSGQGIAPENLTRVYDPFFTTKGARKGTGLGLSVTYGIVQEHAGRINVRSELGRGTCFTVEFPLVTSRRPAALAAVEAASVGPG